jgi:hypothetical protein
MIVDIDEVEKCFRYFKEINSSNIEDIVWTKGNEVLNVSTTDLENFSFIGLSNRDFPAVMGWLPEDADIRIELLSFVKN